MSKRYIDEGYSLLFWATEVESVCPKCHGVGIVKGNPNWRDWNATFFCKECSHSLKTDRDSWQGPILGQGRRPCGSCGHQWVHAEKLFENASRIQKEYAIIKCQRCNSENEVDLKFTKAEPADHAIDPFFGLELALKEDTRHGTVWVYGAPHLEQLKLYIAAQLREGDGTKWSYFTRLPKWVKASKNRELVLHAITKLENRLITTGCSGRCKRH